jgi:hypothetical protein
LGRIGHRKFEGCFLSWTRGHFRERASPGAGAGGDCPLFIFPLLRLLIYPLLYPTIHVGIQR